MTPPTTAFVVGLASLPDVGPARLAALLRRGDPRRVLADLACGRLVVDADLADAIGRRDPRPLLERWRGAAAALDVDALWSAHLEAGVAVHTATDPSWPAAFAGDPDPPSLLFTRGDSSVLGHGSPAVAVVGTRRCTRYGWDVAHSLGLGLAAAGVRVVSGLAKGIDAAAHRGALDAADGAPPVGVVGTGLDVVYPASSRSLWREVPAAGVLASEAPLGTAPARWRFPARNRVLAALADAVVVVESAGTGGALHTVDEALARDRPVFAVPGPITSPVSVGCNRLLADVAAPLCDVDDVLAAVGARPAGTGLARLDPPEPGDLRALEAVAWTPTSLDHVVDGTGLGLGAAAGALARLEAAGHVVPAGPGRWQRVGAPSGTPGHRRAEP